MAVAGGEVSGGDGGPIHGVSLGGVTLVDEEGVPFDLGYGVCGAVVVVVVVGGGALEVVEYGFYVVQIDGAGVAPGGDDLRRLRHGPDPIDAAHVSEIVMLQHGI